MKFKYLSRILRGLFYVAGFAAVTFAGQHTAKKSTGGDIALMNNKTVPAAGMKITYHGFIATLSDIKTKTVRGIGNLVSDNYPSIFSGHGDFSLMDSSKVSLLSSKPDSANREKNDTDALKTNIKGNKYIADSNIRYSGNQSTIDSGLKRQIAHIVQDTNTTDTRPQEVFTGFPADSSASITLTAFPNPNKGNFFVRFTLPQKMNTVLHVYDLVGNVVYENNLGELEGNFTQSVDLIGGIHGIYFIALTYGSKEAVKKMIIN